MIMHHVRWTHKRLQEYNDDGMNRCANIVCCKEGHQPLFPLADAFCCNWKGVPDKDKKTSLLKSDSNLEYLNRLKELLCDPGDEAVYPVKKCRPLPEFNFKPIVAEDPGLAFDVTVCPRYREHGKHRNYSHWKTVVGYLVEAGYRVCLVGMKETSVDVDCVQEMYKSWNYDVLETSLAFMNNSKLVLATDSGLAHLAVLNQRPLKVIYDIPGKEAGKLEWPWALPHMKAHATDHCEPILYGWDDPDKVITQVIEYLDNN